MGLVARLDEEAARRGFRGAPSLPTEPPLGALLKQIIPSASLSSVDLYEDRVSESLQLVGRTNEAFGQMRMALSNYQDEVSCLTRKVTEAIDRNEQMSTELFKAAEMVRAEYDRAHDAEARATHAEQRVDELEHLTKSLTAQLDRLLDAVGQSLVA